MSLFLLADLLLDSGSMPAQRRDRPASRCEVFIGRSLAMCVHPFAAWRSRARSVRVLVLAGYFAAGYVSVLAALFVLT